MLKYLANKHVSKFKSNGIEYNHNSMAVGKYYISEAKIGSELLKLLNSGIKEMALVPYYKRNVKFFADIDNHENSMLIYIYIYEL